MKKKNMLCGINLKKQVNFCDVNIGTIVNDLYK